MEPLRRITRFWNWLPAFRAVAESEHLPTAARNLGVSAPGLSRAIKLIEQDLGHQLFVREGRRIRLGAAGQLFLEHVRDAMRRVDDACRALDERVFEGILRVTASTSVSLTYIVPATAPLLRDYPRLRLDVRTMDERQVPRALRKGEIDVAFLEEIEVPNDLAVERIATTSYGVYCAANHPLARRSTTLEDCLRYPFVGPGGGASDAWPLNLRREIGLRAGSLALAMAICESGSLLAFLPDDQAAQRGGRLKRLSVGTLAASPVFVAYRRPVGGRDRVTVFLEEARRVAAGITKRGGRR